MIKISSTEAVRSFGEYLAKVKHTGESYEILKNNLPVAQLIPARFERRATVADFVAAWGGGDFGDALQEVNRQDQLPGEPWDS